MEINYLKESHTRLAEYYYKQDKTQDSIYESERVLLLD